MKIIDLLNKIAKGEEVPHFIIDEQEYYVGADGFLKEFFGADVEWTLDEEWLNQEVEIIEEEKDIEKLDVGKMLQTKKWKRDKKTYQIINDLIDAVNKLNKKE